MQIRPPIRTVTSCVAAIFLALAMQAAWAAQKAEVTPPDATGIYRYLPPTTAFPSGLDTTSTVSLPSPESHHGRAVTLDKSRHLPIKPIKGQKVNTDTYLLVPLEGH